MSKQIKFAYFGGEPLGVPVLNKLKEDDLLPELVVCNPDRPKGRGHKLTPPPAKLWAQQENIEVFQPTSYKDPVAKEKLSGQTWDLFVVVAYNFILPEWLLEIPKNGTLNVHPSLLPKLRGASPIRTAILDNTPEAVGVTVMLLDKEMDHGPILAQEKLAITQDDWPVSGPSLDQALADMGGRILAKTIPDWINNKIKPREQDHHLATYCSKLPKAKSELFLSPYDLPTGEEAKRALRVISAYDGIGDSFFTHLGKRVKIKRASIDPDGKLLLHRVTPEGKSETDFENYLYSIQ